MVTCLRAMERHLPYRISSSQTRRWRARYSTFSPDRFVDLVVGYMLRCFSCPQTVTGHPLK